MKTKLFGAILAFAVAASPLFGGMDGLRAVRASGPVHIDGKLDETAWQNAPAYENFVNTETKAPAPVRNSVKVLFDDKAIYLGIRCEEPSVDEMKLPPRPRDGGLYQQDCVEVMLDPAHTQEIYWHFIVGAQDTLYDAYRDQGVGVVEVAWNGTWTARSYIGKDFWSCEIKIPFFNFARQHSLAGDWGINVIRNRRTAQRADFGISGVFHEPTRFLLLKGIDCDLKPYQVELTPLAAKTGIDAKGKGNVETTTSIANFTGAEQTYRAENYLKSPSGEIFFSKPAIATAPKGGKTALELPPVTIKKPGVYENTVRVTDSAGRVVANRTAKMEVGFTPLSIHMIDPHYRYTIFATQQLKTVAFDIGLKLPEAARKDKTLAVAIGVPGEKPVWERRFAKPGAITEIRIPTADLPDGRFKVQVMLLDAKGDPVKFATAECPLWKLPYKTGETWIAKDGRVMREGKPNFTIRPDCDWLRGLPEENVIARMTRNGETRPSDLRSGQLWFSGDVLWRIAGGRIPEFRRSMQTGAFQKKHIDFIRSLVQKYRDVPELYAWYWFDEPSSDSLLPSALEYLYTVMKEEDPYHPVWGSDAPTHHYVNAMDVHEHHPYPNVRGPRDVINDCTVIALTADALRRAQERTYHKTALAFCDLGLNKWDWCLGTKDSRIPTVLEFHNQTMMAIAIGTNHIQCFCNDAQCYPEVYIGWVGLLPEFRYVGDHAVQERHVPQPKFSGSKDVRVIATDTRDGYFLVASNASMDRCKVTFTDLPKHLTKLYVVAEKRTVPVKDGVMFDDFGPCEGRAYIEKEPPVFVSVAELSEKVEARWRELAKPGNLLFSRSKDDAAERKCSSIVVNYSGADESNLWHLNDGYLPTKSSGYGLLHWCSHPNDKKPWVEFAPKQRPFTLGRVVIDSLDHSLGKFHIEVFAKGAWKSVYTYEDGTKSNHFECKFAPVTDAEKFRIVVDKPTGPAGKSRMFAPTELPVARIGEVEAYAE